MRLLSVASSIPQGRLEAADIVAAAGRSKAEARVFSRMFGIEQVAAFEDQQSLAGLFLPVLDRLMMQHEGDLPDMLIYVHGQPLQFGPGDSPARDLAARHPFLADVKRHYEVDQHNCGGMFWALDMARIMLQRGLAKSIALLGGDSHLGLPMADRYVPGCTLMGDAVCGLVVSGEAGGLQLSNPALSTWPEFSFGRSGSAEEMGRFFAHHSAMVEATLELARFDWDSETNILPHNVNLLAWQMFSRDHDLPLERVDLSLLPDIGHCYTSDPFLLLDRLLQAEPEQTAPIMLLSVGMGSFVGASTLTPQPSLADGLISAPSLSSSRPAHQPVPSHEDALHV